MKKTTYRLNKEHFKETMARHQGQTHPDIRYNGHHARLDRQCDLAYILNVHRSVISNGFTKGIALDHLIKLADLFGCDWQYLAGLQEYPTFKERRSELAEKANAADDLISRAAAIDALDSIGSLDTDADREYARDIFNSLPPAQPEPKRGRWIEDAEAYYKAVNEKGGGVNRDTPFFTDDIACSECLALFSMIDNEVERFGYCPNCGADMGGEDHETD